MKLFNILEEQILTEGRKEDVMKKFPEATEIIEALSDLDPSGNNKYLDWATKTYVKELGNKFDADAVGRLTDAIRVYHEKEALLTKSNMEEFIEFLHEGGDNIFDADTIEKIQARPKDINVFPTSAAFGKFVTWLSSFKSKKKELEEIKKESDRIYEDDSIIVLSPRTHRSSCFYGKHSTWCVATSNTNYYGNYTKTGNLYFFISKKDEEITKYWGDSTERGGGQGQPAHTPPFKTALLIKDDGDITWWSKGDSNYANGDLADLADRGWVGDPKLPFLTQTIADKILSYNRHAIENRMQKQIEALLKVSNFYKQGSSEKSDFITLLKSNVLKPEQLTRIISNDNYDILIENSDNGRKVRDLIGPNNVFMLTKKFLESDNINKVLKESSNQEFLTNYDNFTEEQARELTGIILKKLGNKKPTPEAGADARIFIDKWTLSPEEWNKYNSITNYLILGKSFKSGKLPKISEIAKVDRFKLSDHKSLERLGLKAEMAGLNLYGIVTEKGLLDQYMDSPDTVPTDVIKKILEKAKLIHSSKAAKKEE